MKRERRVRQIQGLRFRGKRPAWNYRIHQGVGASYMGNRVVFFDVDSVLLDSLEGHLKVCENLNRRFGLGLTIPSPEVFRALVRTGKRISPMRDFFLAVGFPPERAIEADEYYQREFNRIYPSSPFCGVSEMLICLSQAGVVLGLVTSNIQANVEAALGPNWKLFAPRCRFTFDHPHGLTKSGALRTGAQEMGVTCRSMLYVGDQPADYVAAQQAGTGFLGVTYGWGITQEDRDFTTADSPKNIVEYILNEAFHE